MYWSQIARSSFLLFISEIASFLPFRYLNVFSRLVVIIGTGNFRFLLEKVKSLQIHMIYS